MAALKMNGVAGPIAHVNRFTTTAIGYDPAREFPLLLASGAGEYWHLDEGDPFRFHRVKRTRCTRASSATTKSARSSG